jgi:hypothetical protein
VNERTRNDQTRGTPVPRRRTNATDQERSSVERTPEGEIDPNEDEIERTKEREPDLSHGVNQERGQTNKMPPVNERRTGTTKGISKRKRTWWGTEQPQQRTQPTNNKRKRFALNE